MPYISDRERRKGLDAGAVPQTRGDLAYRFFQLMVRDWESGPATYDRAIDVMIASSLSTEFADTQYDKLFLSVMSDYSLSSDEIRVVWEETRNEFRRRFLWPLEDEKLKTNGDVY
jgi:hypothetical protein